MASPRRDLWAVYRMARQGQLDKEVKDMKHNIQLIHAKLDTLLSRQQGVI